MTTKTWEEHEANFTFYLDGLRTFPEEKLNVQPTPESWSAGQIINHLINGTQRFHLNMIRMCLEDVDHGTGDKKERGIKLFENGSFPPIKIQVPPSPTYTPPQATSKNDLMDGLQQTRNLVKSAFDSLASLPASGYQEHGAFGELNAYEWMDLIEMHMRHHRTQWNERIELLAHV